MQIKMAGACRMKRRTMKEILLEVEREIRTVYDMKQIAFNNTHWNDWEKAQERLNALFFCLHLLKGDEVILGCYQSGMENIKYNSGGFTLSGN